MKKLFVLILVLLISVTLFGCQAKISESEIDPPVIEAPDDSKETEAPPMENGDDPDQEYPDQETPPADDSDDQTPPAEEPDDSILKTYKENFEDFEGVNSSQYQDYIYESSGSGLVWNLYWARIDLNLEQRAVTFKGRHRPDGYYGGMETQLEEGLTYVAFQAKLPYEEKGHDVKIDVYVNQKAIKQFTIPFKDTKNIYTFELDMLDYRGETSFEIAIESGKVVTIDNIILKSNSKKQEEMLVVYEDFENQAFEYDVYETERIIGGIPFIVKEVQTKDMHQEKEVPFLTEKQGLKVSRFRGAGKDYSGTPEAYMYTKEALAFISSVSFDAKYFSEYNTFAQMNVYIQAVESQDWVLIESIELSLVYESYQVFIHKENVKIKIEVLYSSVNVDNLSIFK